MIFANFLRKVEFPYAFRCQAYNYLSFKVVDRVMYLLIGFSHKKQVRLQHDSVHVRASMPTFWPQIPALSSLI